MKRERERERERGIGEKKKVHNKGGLTNTRIYSIYNLRMESS